VIWGGAPTPLLRGMGLFLSVAPSLNGVMDITVIVDLVAHGGCQGERSRLHSYRGLVPRVRGRSKLLLEVSPLLPLSYGA
jgi:hypothetical protein